MKSIVYTAPTVLFAGFVTAGLLGSAGLAKLGGMAIAPPSHSFTPSIASDPESSANPSSFTPSASAYSAPMVGQPLRTEGGGTR